MLPVGKETGKSDSVFLFACVGIKGFYRAGIWCWPVGPGGGGDRPYTHVCVVSVFIHIIMCVYIYICISIIFGTV